MSVIWVVVATTSASSPSSAERHPKSGKATTTQMRLIRNIAHDLTGPTPRTRGALDPKLGEKALLGLALHRGDHFHVVGERRAAQLGRKQVVDLKDARGIVHGDLDPHRFLR